MRRKMNYREQVQRFLIVCEGKATEPQYFRDFRVPGDIRSIVVEGLGRSAVSLALRFPYTKNIQGLYLRLLPVQAEAVKNAKRLLKQYSIEDPCANDPSTTVFQLVEELNRFSPDTRGSSASRNQK